MATLLNRKIGYLTLVDKTIRTAQIDDLAVGNAQIKNADVAFGKANDSFAAALLDTTKRAVYPMIGGDKQTLPAASSMDVSALMGAVAESSQAPVYNAALRAWDNLGAVTYPAENKVLIRVPDPASAPDGTGPLRSATGAEVFGRLTRPLGVWTVSFFTTDGTTESAYTLPATVNAFMVFKQWVPGSSSLLEDMGKLIVSAPGAVDITERNDLDQLAKELGVTLGANGQMTLTKSISQRIADHVAGTAERHSSNMIDAHVDVNISNFADGGTLTAALNQLQQNITTASGGSSQALETYFNELRSNGVLGVADVLSDALAGDLTVNVAACVAYVAGKRFEIPAQTVTVPAASTTYLWVTNAGVVQQGAAYPPALDTIAKLGEVVSDATAIVVDGVTDEHRALVELDQKVLDVEKMIADHIGDELGAHAASAISLTEVAGLFKADGITLVANAQEAIESLHRRLGAIKREEEIFVLSQAMIDGAVVDGALKYILLSLSGGKTYEINKGKMECIIDGDDQDLGRVFTEASTSSVRIYFDPAESLVAGQRVKLRWLAV